MLDRLQGDLEAIYRLDIPYRVVDFVVDRAMFEQVRPDATAPEELLILEEDGELHLGLYVDEDVLDDLAEYDPDDPGPGVVDEGLAAWSTALEGVSHFVYVAHQAGRRPVSLLELEAQAEVDKFVTALLHLWRRGQKGSSARLRRRLFDEVGYRDDLDAEAEDRYRTANSLARRYCRRLEARYVHRGSPEALLRELRTVYRMSGAEKLSFLAVH